VKEEDIEDGEICNELPASVPVAVDISNNQQSSSATPDSVVHNLNGAGSMKPSSLQIRKGTRNAHVILADLSPCKPVYLHLGRVSSILEWLVLLFDHLSALVLVVMF